MRTVFRCVLILCHKFLQSCLQSFVCSHEQSSLPESLMTTYVAPILGFLVCVSEKSLALASRQPIASSCTDDRKDPNFITPPQSLVMRKRKDTV